MSSTANTAAADAGWMQRRLAEHGVAVLAVIPNPEPGWFTVYVQGPYGDYERCRLLEFLVALPKVTDVLVSDLTNSILRVYRAPDASA